MIILRILGGLGNQLFIYAFGRALEINYGFDVHYDCYTGFIKDKYKRKFELENFSIKIKKASLSDSIYLPIRKRSNVTANILYPNSFYIQDDKNFSVEQLIAIEKKSKKVFLQGYFQKVQYFENIKEELKKEIVLTKPLSEKAKDYLDKIKNSNSIAVHIRLKERANTNKWNFYFDNISRLKIELSNPVFFIFSDDIKFCKENLGSDTKFIFIENTDNHIEDFWLMKNCNHFIISNSTFSWWASWLSDNHNKIILQPLS